MALPNSRGWVSYLTPVVENGLAAEPDSQPSQQSDLTEDDLDAGTVVTGATDDSPPPFTSVEDWKQFVEDGGDAQALLMEKMFSWKGLEFNDTRYLFIMNGLAEIKRTSQERSLQDPSEDEGGGFGWIVYYTAGDCEETHRIFRSQADALRFYHAMKDQYGSDRGDAPSMNCGMPMQIEPTGNVEELLREYLDDDSETSE